MSTRRRAKVLGVAAAISSASPRSRRAARRRTRGSSRASRSARPCGGRGSSRRATGAVEVGVADRLGGLERAAPGRRRAARTALLVLVEQVVAPLDRRAQRRLAGSASRPPLSRSSRCAEPLDDLLRREHLRARGGELDARAAGRPGAGRAPRPPWAVRQCARSQKSSPLRASASGSTSYSTSPRTRSSSRLVTSSVRFGHASTASRRARARRRSTCSRLSSSSSCSRSPMCAASSPCAPTACATVGHDERRVAQRREGDPEHAGAEVADELRRGLDRQARLPRAARRRSASRAARRSRSSAATSAISRSRPTKLDAGRGRFVLAIVFSGGNLLAELEDPHRLVEVLQPVLAQIAQARRRERRASHAESTTWPPWPAAAIRAPRWTSRPT